MRHHTRVWCALQKLWTKATGTEGYDKLEWQAFEALVTGLELAGWRARHSDDGPMLMAGPPPVLCVKCDEQPPALRPTTVVSDGGNLCGPQWWCQACVDAAETA